MSEETFEVTLPKLGESIVGATVVNLLKKIGDPVAIDEPLLEVSTDKVNSEIPSPVAGTIQEILVKPDQEILIGAPMIRISLHSNAKKITEAVSEPPSQEKVLSTEKGKEEVFSPAVLRLANIEGLPLETLRKIEGTGEGGRITKKDVECFVATKNSTKTVEAPCPLKTKDSFEERVQMSGMRKAIAENMVRSFYEAPHASVVAEADVTEVMNLISREKERFKDTHGVKLTITSFLIQALSKAIGNFPMLNASLEKETIVMKRYVNVGIAVNIDKGLVVPVVKNCQERNLVSIAKALSDLSSKARSAKLAPDEVTGGTITLTNFGMTGALIGVPIIRYPEVAIIGAGAVEKRIVVREDDSFSIRQMMYLTLTFDHRVIDGIYGCEFLASFKDHLESVSLH